MKRVLLTRLDNDGDVLLAGPAIRAVAHSAEVVLLVGPRGRSAARLLPGVDDLIVWHCPWIDPHPQPVRRASVEWLVAQVARRDVAEAVILGSFHQSPLPTALLLRLAGVPVISAVSEDYPGALLDVRHRVADDLHEVERALSTVGTLGYALPPGDDRRLVVNRPGTAPRPFDDPYVVVHPAASVSARAWAPERSAATVDALVRAGWRVAVTGTAADSPVTRMVVGANRAAVRDLTGDTDLAALADVLAGAVAVVVGNTGPAHLAAAVGTPVVSLFAPTVAATKWAPWQVPMVLLGDQDIPCAGCRARTCPVPGHPCLGVVTPAEVVAAVERLAAARPVASR